MVLNGIICQAQSTWELERYLQVSRGFLEMQQVISREMLIVCVNNKVVYRAGKGCDHVA